jgi:hypothetical protein
MNSDAPPMYANGLAGRRFAALAKLALIAALTIMTSVAFAQPSLTMSADMMLDPQALLMPANATYGRALNGISYQDSPLASFNGYQYATWYHYTDANTERIYLGRRNLATNVWESFDLGKELSNGDAPVWDAHNVISMGISGDGRIHLSYDMHVNNLRYQESQVGVASNPESTAWNASIFGSERSKLNPAHPTLGSVTYPRFSTGPDGDMVMTFRRYSSGNGDVALARYDSETHSWSAAQDIINRGGSYTDSFGTSTNRNAYLNGVNYSPDGTMHTTWVWREATPSGRVNRDLNYAYSEDKGVTWKNNQGAVIGSSGNPVTTNSLGIIIAELDRKQMLFNQQAQVVDDDGRVHAVMWHRRDEPGFEWTNGDGMDINKADAAYYHYYRDSDNGDWTRRRLSVEEPVGSRPEIAYDQDGNMFAAYVSPGPTDPVAVHSSGRLVIAGASKATNYSDWTVLHVDERNFIGEPMIDRDRLRNEGILSVFLQENSTTTSNIGSPLHLLEFAAEPASFNTHLRGHFPFDGNGNDFATNDGAQDLTLFGNATTSAPGTIGAGRLVVNGGADRASVASNFTANRNAVTITAWFTPGNVITGAGADDYTIVQMPIAGGTLAQSAAGLDISDGRLQVGGRALSTDTFQGVLQSDILEQGKTYFAAAVIDYEADRITSYLYDVANATWTTATATVDFGADFAVGDQGLTIGRRADGQRNFYGSIDDVRIYAAALNQESVQSLAAAFTGDFDQNGIVDGHDFLLWQRGLSPTPLSSQALGAWAANYGGSNLNNAAASRVPEPNTAILLAWVVTMSTSVRESFIRQQLPTALNGLPN